MLTEFRQLVYKSLILDFDFFTLSPISIIDKLEFIYIKYKILIKHLLLPFTLGKSKTRIFGNELFYNFGRVGLVTMQRILTYHAHLLTTAKITNPHNIVDIGANVGFFSLFCGQQYPQAQIYAFEPIRETYEILCKNIQPSKNIRGINKAISNHNQSLNMSYNSSNSEISQIVANGSERVEAQTLDSFVTDQSISIIDLLKIDAEEHELQVLIGAEKTLERTKYVYVEINLENNNNYTFSQLITRFYSSKYNFQLIGLHKHNPTQRGKITSLECLFQNINL